MKRWLEVEARVVDPPADWSLWADVFERFGCNSSLVSTDGLGLIGYLEALPGSSERLAELDAALRRAGADGVEVREVEDQDWSEIWKKHFKPVRIGRHFVIVPSWEDFQPGPDDVRIDLDPGQAFGTGEHPTTQLCLELLERFPPTAVRRTALDLGCGSGVLAIGAAKLGYGSVAAADIEAAAVEIARENASRNGISIELYAGDGFEIWARDRQWDLVLSNIISATLIRLAPDAARYVSPGGVWIVSGILEPNWPEVRQAAERSGFTLEADQVKEGWVGAALRRTAS